ncbi:MAG: hypothetical protein WA140_09790 [Geobacteraceae bacterium]
MNAANFMILYIVSALMLNGCGGGGGGDTSTAPATKDTTAPSVSTFSMPATATSLTVTVTSFTASDNIGVTGYLITESATAPSATATGWTASASATFTFSGAGVKTAYAWAKDASGNVSSARSAAVTITLPITAAIATQITGSNAESTISISGATSPIIYGFEVTVNFPVGATFVSVVVIGVNSGIVEPGLPGGGNVFIGSLGSSGFGSGDVLRVTFTNVPGAAQPTGFTLSGFTAFDGNGAPIP